MDQTTPPSPAPSMPDGLPSGFNQLVQHNEATSYPRDQAAMDTIQVASQPGSRYGTPVPQVMHSYWDPMQYHYQPAYQHETSPYPSLPDDLPMYNTPAQSPPTPSQRSDVITLRSGGSIPRGSSASSGLKPLAVKSGRIEKSKASSKKKKKKEKAKPVNPDQKALGKSLSELAKEWPDVQVMDIEQYVHRPVEDRQAEVDRGKTPGHIKRPMNAFLLYRKAYQHLSKHLATHNNHQIVSQMCGQSWPLETQAVRDQFNEWAKIERDNHHKAHPSYKFTPQKPKKKLERDERDDGDVLDDYEWGDEVSHHSRSRTPNDPDGEYLPPRSAYAVQYRATAMGHGAALHQSRSTFQFTNPGKPVPAPYNQGDLIGGQYYQQEIRPGQNSQISDVLIRKTASPGLAYHGQPGDVGFDLASHYAPLQQHHQLVDQLPQQQGPQIDPSLMGQNGMYDANFFMSGDMDGGKWQVPSFGDADAQQFQETFSGFEDSMLQEQQAQLLRGDESSWKIEPLEAAQFDDDAWMGSTGPDVNEA